MKESEQRSGVSTTSVSLLSEGKSTRLLQMRQKAMGKVDQQSAPAESSEAALNQAADEELHKIKQLIDRRLQEVMAEFPPNKRQRFFKIRYGLTPDQLKLLPIREILAVLKLKQIQSTGMKRVADLDYNGRPTSNRAER